MAMKIKSRGAESHFATPMNHVRQIAGTECGAACLAMLARVTLQEARAVLYGDPLPRHLGTTSDDVRAALANFGLVLGRFVPSAAWGVLERRDVPALVSVGYRSGTVNGVPRIRRHWVVFDPCRPATPVLDPLSKVGPRAPGRSQMLGYHHVRLLNKPP